MSHRVDPERNLKVLRLYFPNRRVGSKDLRDLFLDEGSSKSNNWAQVKELQHPDSKGKRMTDRWTLTRNENHRRRKEENERYTN